LPYGAGGTVCCGRPGERPNGAFDREGRGNAARPVRRLNQNVPWFPRAGRRVLFTTCALLVQDLLAAKRDLTLTALLKRLGQYEALLVDDLGYVQQSREEMEVLFTRLAERYERGSVLVTSNLPFSQWDQIFKDPMRPRRRSTGWCTTASSWS
jgi:DNA replication protein DnaC